jgi:hypothetical protein
MGVVLGEWLLASSLLDRGEKKRESQGLKPGIWAGWDVRAQARTYLRCKGNGKGENQRQEQRPSRFPEGMTERKASASATATANTGVSPLRRKRAPTVEMTKYGWGFG